MRIIKRVIKWFFVLSIIGYVGMYGIKSYKHKAKQQFLRSPSPPFISGDGFRAYADYIFDETNQKFHPKDIKTGDIIFVKTDMLKEFFLTHHKNIANAYILITHNADNDVPFSDTHEPLDFSALLEDKKIIAWFAQNANLVHPKLIPIPIGVENRYCAGKKLQIINNLKNKKKNKFHWLYMNFNVGTFPVERSYIYQLFLSKPFCKTANQIPANQFYQDIKNSRFILCPRGNGLDCHRTWEALYLGSFPVVRKSAMQSLYEGLPVVVVNNWEEVTEEFLQQKYEELSSKAFNMEKITMQYWYDYIDKVKSEAGKTL